LTKKDFNATIIKHATEYVMCKISSLKTEHMTINIRN